MVSNKVGNDSPPPPVLNSSSKEKRGVCVFLFFFWIGSCCTAQAVLELGVVQAPLDIPLAFNAWGSAVPASWEYVLFGLLESLTVAGFCRSPGFLHRCHSRVIENRPRVLQA